MTRILLVLMLFLLPLNGWGDSLRKGWSIKETIGFACNDDDCTTYRCAFNESKKEAYCIKEQPKDDKAEDYKSQYYREKCEEYIGKSEFWADKNNQQLDLKEKYANIATAYCTRALLEEIRKDK